MINPEVREKYQQITDEFSPQSDASKPRIPFDMIIWLEAHGLYSADFASSHSKVEIDLILVAHNAFQESRLIAGYENTIVSSLMERARQIRR